MQTQTKNKQPLTPAQTAALIGALAPVKVSKAGSVKANVKAESKPLLALPKPKKGNINGVFGGIAVELGRMITKPAILPPEKPTDEVREQVLNGLGVHGNPIKQVAKRCTGLNSAATIWGAIDTYRAANEGVMPTAAIIDAMKLMCVKRGELFESRVKLANIKCELWAYACYYQIPNDKGKSPDNCKGLGYVQYNTGIKATLREMRTIAAGKPKKGN